VHGLNAGLRLPRVELQQIRIKYFNVVALPPWGIDDKQVYAAFNTTHIVTSYVFVALIVIHAAAALTHLLRRDGSSSGCGLAACARCGRSAAERDCDGDQSDTAGQETETDEPRPAEREA
jgi:hypothetical protein